MLFEVVNEKGDVVFTTTYASCIPDNDCLSSLSKNGYKFKVEGRSSTMKKVGEYRNKGILEEKGRSI